MRKKNRKIRTGFNFNIILLVLIPAALMGMTVAKYILNEHFKVEYQAKNFYFQSDLLSDSTEQPEYTYPEGTDSIAFYLRNNDDNLRYSEVDVDYTVTLSKGEEVIDTVTGKIEKNSINLKRIEFTNLQEGDYTVIAKSTSPYERILSANFTIPSRDDSIEYQVSDTANNGSLILTVTTKDYEGNIIISYPDGVVPDSTDSKLTNITADNITVYFEENSSYTFTFLKINPANVYTQSDFSMKKQET